MLCKLKPKKPYKNKKYRNKNNSTHFFVVDLYQNIQGNRVFRRRFIYQTRNTFQKILRYAESKNAALLYRGLYLLKREEILEYRKNKYIKLPYERKIAEFILIDIDKDDKETNNKVKAFIKYIQKANLTPFVFKTQKGYHLYLAFIPPNLILENKHITLKEIEKYEEIYFHNEKIDKEKISTIYKESDKISDKLLFCHYRETKIIESGIKYILEKKIGLDYDIVSSSQAVWYEGIHNPIKNHTTKLIFAGNYVEWEYAYRKLYYFGKYYRHNNIKKSKKHYIKENKKSTSSIFEHISTSNPIKLLQANYRAGFHLALQNIHPTEAHAIFEHALGTKIDEKLFFSFYEFCMKHKKETYKKDKVKNIENETKEKKREVTKYAFHVDAIHKVLSEHGLGLSKRKIAKLSGVPLASTIDILKRVDSEVILYYPKAAKSLLIHGSRNALTRAERERRLQALRKAIQTKKVQQTPNDGEWAKETGDATNDPTGRSSTEVFVGGGRGSRNGGSCPLSKPKPNKSYPIPLSSFVQAYAQRRLLRLYEVVSLPKHSKIPDITLMYLRYMRKNNTITNAQLMQNAIDYYDNILPKSYEKLMEQIEKHHHKYYRITKKSIINIMRYNKSRKHVYLTDKQKKMISKYESNKIKHIKEITKCSVL